MKLISFSIICLCNDLVIKLLVQISSLKWGIFLTITSNLYIFLRIRVQPTCPHLSLSLWLSLILIFEQSAICGSHAFAQTLLVWTNYVISEVLVRHIELLLRNFKQFFRQFEFWMFRKSLLLCNFLDYHRLLIIH